MSHHVLRLKTKCRPCSGTGVFNGLAERDGAVVVCNVCRGTGCHTQEIEYDDFDGRMDCLTAKRVFKTNPGIMIGTGNGLSLENFGGISYDDWKSGRPFPKKSEMREYVCPAWWYQGADYKKKPNWRECLACGSFNSCSNFGKKELCWARFDREQAQGAKIGADFACA